jgi:hypothetical protein
MHTARTRGPTAPRDGPRPLLAASSPLDPDGVTRPGGWLHAGNARWRRLSRRHQVYVVLTALLVVLLLVAAVVYVATGRRLLRSRRPQRAPDLPRRVRTDRLGRVVPIFPGETTLNAASTAAAQDTLDLLPVIVIGALGAIVADSCLFWLARRSARRIAPQLERAKANPKVRQGLDMMSGACRCSSSVGATCRACASSSTPPWVSWRSGTGASRADRS